MDKTIDVRGMPPAERHPLIFSALDGLDKGEAVIIVNDHDPKPLGYQLEAEHPGEYEFAYIEQGPVDWRVRIGRRQ